MKIRNAQELMRDNLIVKHKAGSHSYGTAIETSDEDFRGIFVGDALNVRTPFFPIKEAEDPTEEDTKLFELSNYMKLCLDCNPNIIETLWIDRNDIVFDTPEYDLLRSYRREFLSSKVAFTTSGYALAQLKRIKGHNKWINSPQPEKQPEPCDYISVVQWFGAEKNLNPDLKQYRNNFRLIPYGGDIFAVVHYKGMQLWDNNGNLNTNYEPDEDRSKLPSPLMIVKWNRDVFKVALEKWQQYWTWKRERNKTRSALEEEFGYDTKHAMHLVRLLRMGKEALETGEINVRRPDAAELLSIRNGAWTYDDLVKYAEEMDNEVTQVLYKTTSLPRTPNTKLAAKVIIEIQDLIWSRT